MSTMITIAIDEAVAELVPLVGKRAACTAVGLPRASYYRANPVSKPAAQPSVEPTPQPGLGPAPGARQTQPRALSDVERARVLEVLHSERFADTAPATVWATLLDEGTYLCSESTMYRLLRERGETRERRRQATHPATVKPELVATRANECWSWDITKLRGPAKWTWFYLLVTWNQAAWLRSARRQQVEHDRDGAEVAGAGSTCPCVGVASGVGGLGPGSADDRRVCQGAGRVPAFV